MKHSSYKDIQRARNLAVDMFAEHRAVSDVARYVGFSRQTVSRWHSVWEKQGPEGLKVGTPGPVRGLGDEQLEQVKQALLEGPRAHGYDTELWTLDRIIGLVLAKTGIRYSQTHIWRLLKRLGWSCQKPERKARERDEAEITRWKAQGWPRIKKGRKKQEQDSSF